MIAAPPPTTRRPPPVRVRPGQAVSRAAAFRYAFTGIWVLISTQRNAQIHLAIGALVVLAGLVFGIAQYEWLALVVTITLVLAAEAINTAIEAVVDLASPEYHALAKIAKDVGAGAVLICAIGSVAVGVIIFLPRIWALLGALA
jgi:diacylglycerol kinase (ATP)